MHGDISFNDLFFIEVTGRQSPTPKKFPCNNFSIEVKLLWLLVILKMATFHNLKTTKAQKINQISVKEVIQ